ncbi:MAG: hypothetical protein N2645_00840 [Clostridia bacterium]|nr:hypothetical protein [Clostridia bacterium]
MENKKTPGDLKECDVIITVYNHYQQLALNEHCRINERMTHFFLGNTFLFSGFISCVAVSSQNPFFFLMARIRFWLPIISVLLAFIYALFFIIPTIKALKVWSSKLEEIEKKYLNQYMELVCLPFEARKKFSKYASWPLYIGFPLQLIFFIILWGISIHAYF